MPKLILAHDGPSSLASTSMEIATRSLAVCAEIAARHRSDVSLEGLGVVIVLLTVRKKEIFLHHPKSLSPNNIKYIKYIKHFRLDPEPHDRKKMRFEGS